MDTLCWNWVELRREPIIFYEKLFLKEVFSCCNPIPETLLTKLSSHGRIMLF